MKAKAQKNPQNIAVSAPSQELILKKPNDYSPEIAAAICARLMDGESLNNVCRDPAMPRKPLVYEWLNAHPEFANQYARATEMRTEHLFDEMYDAATDGRNDFYDRPVYNGKGEVVRTERVLDNEAVARSRLRVDALKWIMSKMNPRKYGDKLDVSMDATLRPGEPKPADVPFTAMDPIEAIRRYQELMK